MEPGAAECALQMQGKIGFNFIWINNYAFTPYFCRIFII